MLAAALLENSGLAGTGSGLWLGPALWVALTPLAGPIGLPFWLSGLLATAVWAIGHPLLTIWLVPLHWLLVAVAARQGRRWWLLVAAAAPLLGQLPWLTPQWSYLPGALASLGLQWLAAVAGRSELESRLQSLAQQARERKAAHGVALVGSVEAQLGKLTGVAQEITASTDQLYAIYRDLELLTRGNPSIPTDLSNRLLAAAQEGHQAKLRLAMLKTSVQENLRFLAGRQGATLGEICRWVAAKLEADAEQLDRLASTTVELGDDPIVATETQVPLAFLLQTICQQELRSLNAMQTSVHFAGYGSNGRLRVVVTLQRSGNIAHGDWPLLRPLPLGQLATLASQLGAQCMAGTTASGQRVLTVELG